MASSLPLGSLKGDALATLLGWRVAVLLIPVLVTMLAVSWSVVNLSNLYIEQQRAPFFLVMSEDKSESIQGKIGSSLVNALAVVLTITVVTFLIVLLYKYRCEKVLFGWLMLSACSILFVMLWVWLDLICTRFQIPYDLVTAVFLLWNFGVVGLISLFYYSHPAVAQVYLVVVSIVVAWSMTFLPEWTAWSIVVAIALYDIVAVLCPHGPLRLLVEAAEERNEPLPGFLYDTSTDILLAPSTASHRQQEEEMGVVSRSSVGRNPDSLSQPLSHMSRANSLYHSLTHNPFKLGLGDFIFYSLLCGKAAEFSFIPWIMSVTAVLLGLVGTLVFLLLMKGKIRALPALPISICLGVAVFFLCRYVVFPFDWFATMLMLAL